jgi:hypothetical protein
MSAWIIASVTAVPGVVSVPSSRGRDTGVAAAGGAIAWGRWSLVCFLRTLGMGGVLGNECESFGGISTSVPRHHRNFNEPWDSPPPAIAKHAQEI